MKRRGGIICALLVFVSLLDTGETIESVKRDNGDSGITSAVTYEYATYSCDAEESSALFTVMANGDQATQPVLSLTSVLDLSGSMAGADRISLMQDTNVFLLKELAELDNPHRFGTVTFSTGTRELVPLDVIRLSSVQGISNTIKGTRAGGSTNLLAGIEEGFKQQTQDRASGHFVRVIFVFTDGRPNGSPEGIVAKAKALVAQRPDVAIYTFGYGSNLDYTLLHRLAEVGRGTASIIKKPEDMATAFGAALAGKCHIITQLALRGVYSVAGLLSQVADSIKYTVTPANGAQVKSVKAGGTIRPVGNGFEVDLGDMQQGELRTAIINFVTAKSCTAAEPVAINGENTNSGTGQGTEDKPDSPTFDRNPKPPPQEPEVVVVAERLRRSVFDERFSQATNALTQGNEAGAIQALESLVKDLEATGMQKKVVWIKRGLEDVKIVLGQLKSTSSTNALTFLIADLYSIWDAITKQRTGSTNQNLQSVKYITTTAKEELSTKAKREVLDIIPPAPFTLSINSAVSQTRKEKGDNIIDVLYALEALPSKKKRPPLSLTVVVDTSQSMNGDAMKKLITTLKRLVDWLDAKEDANVLLGVITYSDAVHELLPLTKLSGIDVPKVKASFEAIQAGGQAKIDAALTKGVNQQLSFARCSGSRVVFLLSSSGSASSSDAIVRSLQSQIGSKKSLLSVYTFAMGNADVKQMEKIAVAGNGQRYILSSPDDIPTSFGDAIGGLLGISAKNIKIMFAPADPAVEIISTFPGGVSQGGGAFNVSEENIFESERREFMVTVRFPESSDPALILSIAVCYVDADTCGVAESTVASIGPGERSPKSMKQRRMERDVAVKLKQASDICMTTTNLEEAIGFVRDANYVVATSATGDYRWALIVDLMHLRGKLRCARDGTETRDSACAQVKALTELFETKRYKCMDSNHFLVSKYYDSDTRKKSRKAMTQRSISQTVCQKSNSAVAELRSQISNWMRDTSSANFDDLYVQTTEHQSRASMQDVTDDVTSGNAFEEHDALTEEVAMSFMRLDDALAHGDITTALTEASIALRRLQESPRHDDDVVYAMADHLLERCQQLLESVDSACYAWYGSDRNTPLAGGLGRVVDKETTEEETKPYGETHDSFFWESNFVAQ